MIYALKKSIFTCITNQVAFVEVHDGCEYQTSNLRTDTWAIIYKAIQQEIN